MDGGYSLREEAEVGGVFFDLISGVCSGEAPISPLMASKMLAEFTRAHQPEGKEESLSKLSAREMEVLEMVAQGKTNKDIAASLIISESTVKTHITNIFQKLDVDSRKLN